MAAVRAIAVSLVAAALAVTIRRDNPAFALLIAVSAALFAMWTALEPLRELTDELFMLAEEANLQTGVITAVLKCVAIGILARFGADILRDSGMGAAASSVELLGVAAGLWSALPLLRMCLDAIRSGL
ncbi:MAG: hypothetical protein IJ788_04910 [Oscillospiraceae bacterium]|nr:hypothetical protein [Oscillospiraceae bacterium]